MVKIREQVIVALSLCAAFLIAKTAWAVFKYPFKKKKDVSRRQSCLECTKVWVGTDLQRTNERIVDVSYDANVAYFLNNGTMFQQKSDSFYEPKISSSTTNTNTKSVDGINNIGTEVTTEAHNGGCAIGQGVFIFNQYETMNETLCASSSLGTVLRLQASTIFVTVTLQSREPIIFLSNGYKTFQLSKEIWKEIAIHWTEIIKGLFSPITTKIELSLPLSDHSGKCYKTSIHVSQLGCRITRSPENAFKLFRRGNLSVMLEYPKVPISTSTAFCLDSLMRPPNFREENENICEMTPMQLISLYDLRRRIDQHIALLEEEYETIFQMYQTIEYGFIQFTSFQPLSQLNQNYTFEEQYYVFKNSVPYSYITNNYPDFKNKEKHSRLCLYNLYTVCANDTEYFCNY